MVPSTISVHINSATDNVGACYTYVACNDKASQHPHCASACTLVHQVADDRLSTAHHGSNLLTTLVGCLSVVALVRMMASGTAAGRYQNDSDARSIKARSACGRVVQVVLPSAAQPSACRQTCTAHHLQDSRVPKRLIPCATAPPHFGAHDNHLCGEGKATLDDAFMYEIKHIRTK